jgi:iron(III) transport system permease protein
MSRPLLILALAVLAVCGLAPIAVMVQRLAAQPEVLGDLLDERTLGLLGRTVRLGAGAAGIALVLGLPFGWLTTRSDVPGAALWRPLGLVSFVLPPLMLAVTWTVLSELRGALMTTMLMGLGTFPIVALFSAKAAGRIDARRVEAAQLSGGLRAVLRMELPLILPAALCGACFAFVFAVSDFAVPDYVSSVGGKFNVYADEVFAIWQLDQQDARAVGTALPLVALILLALLPALVLRRRGALATVDSDFQRAQALRLGPWRWPALTFCLALVTLGALIPVGRLIYEAGGGRTAWSLEQLRAAFAQAIDLTRDNISASVLYSIAAASVAAPVAFIIGHAITRGRWACLLEPLVILPLAVPAILFGIGNISLWNHDWSYGFYSGGGLVIAMMIGRFLAFPTLVGAGATASLDPCLEEAAALAGAGPATRLARISAPAVLPSLAGGWVMVFVLSMRELDAAILVPAANHTAMFRMFNAVHFGRDDFVSALALLIVFATVVPGLLWTLLLGRRLEMLP